MAGVVNLAGRTSPGPHAVAGRRSRAPGWVHAVLLLVVLLALSWQSYVVGTHAHQPQTVSAPAGQTLHRAPAQDRRAPAPDSCPICQQISVAAAYLPAPPVSLVVPIGALAWYGADTALDRLPRQRSHRWRSRGPPSAPILSS